MKLTKAQKSAVRAAMLQRARDILSSDSLTDGYYEDLARALKHDDISKNSTEAIKEAALTYSTIDVWLTKLPGVS